MALAIENLPKSYKSRVNWYVSYWDTNTIYVFKTKFEAMQYYHKNKPTNPLDIVCIDWFVPKIPLSKAISAKAKIVDLRS